MGGCLTTGRRFAKRNVEAVYKTKGYYMNKRITALIAIVALVIALAGCSCSNNTNSTNTAKNAAEDVASKFGNYHPAMKEYVYHSAEEKIISNQNVPDSYREPATMQGKLQYEDYNTFDYNGDMRPMQKYLVVYTPFGYAPDKEYDILYVTHGHTGGATTWIGSPTDPHNMKNVLDHLMENGEVRPMIVVSVTYYDDNKDEETSDYDMEILNSFGKELRNDIIPFVESKYSTYAKSTDPEGLKASRDHRIMGGFSMGGVTTCMQMCESMDYFRFYMPVSGSLYWTTDAYSNRKNFDAGAKMENAIKAQGYGKDDFFVYTSTGTVDFAKTTVEMQFEDVNDHPSMFKVGLPGEEGVNYCYGLGQNEGHNAHGRETAVYNALPAISALIGMREM